MAFSTRLVKSISCVFSGEQVGTLPIRGNSGLPYLFPRKKKQWSSIPQMRLASLIASKDWCNSWAHFCIMDLYNRLCNKVIREIYSSKKIFFPLQTISFEKANGKTKTKQKIPSPLIGSNTFSVEAGQISNYLFLRTAHSSDRLYWRVWLKNRAR